MMGDRFRAIVAEQSDGKYKTSLKEIGPGDLPEGDVLVDVAYSDLNYKDGLAITGRGKVIRRFPMICGIDLAGTVAESRAPDFEPGDKVAITGCNLSETNPGGYTQRERVNSAWLIKIPAALDPKRAMAIGTAGFTAMLCVMALERAGVAPGRGEVVVTGAAGGVGSVAVAILKRLGYAVAAATGRPEAHDYLKSLGAAAIVDRAELAAKGAPLQSERWAGGVDTVGGQTLATVIAQTAYGGAVAACGLAGGADLPGSVFPFILRSVALLGVESVQTPMGLRKQAWERLAQDLPLDKLDAMTTVEPLARVPELAGQILAGKVRGRVVIDVNA